MKRRLYIITILEFVKFLLLFCLSLLDAQAIEAKVVIFILAVMIVATLKLLVMIAKDITALFELLEEKRRLK